MSDRILENNAVPTAGAPEKPLSYVLKGKVLPLDIKATVTIDHGFVIHPNISGEGAFEPTTLTVQNQTALPVQVSMESLAAKEENPVKVAAQGKFPDWNKLGRGDTQNNIALGFKNITGGTANEEAFFFEEEGKQTPHALFTLESGGAGSAVLQAKFGRSWDGPGNYDYTAVLKLKFHTGKPKMRAWGVDNYDAFRAEEVRNCVIHARIVDGEPVPEDAVKQWDVSEAQDGSVMAWVTNTPGGFYTSYDLTISGKGGVLANENSAWLFFNFNKMESLDLGALDTSEVTNYEAMFQACSKLTALDVRGFQTAKATNMKELFKNCSALTSLDLKNFDTRNVRSMNCMFQGNRALTRLDVSSFDTQNVTDMNTMFGECIKLPVIDVSRFDTSNAEYICGMFAKCEELTSLELSHFDTHKALNMAAMFSGCLRLRDLNVSSFDTTATKVASDVQEMFKKCTGVMGITLGPKWDKVAADTFYQWSTSQTITVLGKSSAEDFKISEYGWYSYAKVVYVPNP